MLRDMWAVNPVQRTSPHAERRRLRAPRCWDWNLL